MHKKSYNSIYHFKDCFQVQKLNCVLKIRFNKDQLTPRAEKIKLLHAIKAKWSIRIYCQARISTVFTHRKSKGITV